MTYATLTIDEIVRAQTFVIKLLLDTKHPEINLVEHLRTALDALSKSEGDDAAARHLKAIRSVLPRRH